MGEGKTGQERCEGSGYFSRGGQGYGNIGFLYLEWHHKFIWYALSVYTANRVLLLFWYLYNV